MLAVFAVVALAVAVFTGSRPAAAAVAAAGGLSLLIFLLVDLPDVNVEGAARRSLLLHQQGRARDAGSGSS